MASGTGRVIGIAGGTASGKTLLAETVRAAAPGRVAVLPLDWYYRCNAHLPPGERALVNYDHPDAFDVELLVGHLRALRTGTPVETPRYDFATHSRLPSTATVAPVPILVVEGILCFHFPLLRELFDTRVFVNAPVAVRLRRRLERDVRERGRTEDSVLRQWRETVEPMHERFCEPGRRFADHVVDGEGDFRIFAELVLGESR